MAPGLAHHLFGCDDRRPHLLPQRERDRVRRRDGHTEQRQRNPETELPEVIRMPRPAPQSDIADAIAVRRIGAEAAELEIRNALTEDANAEKSARTAISRCAWVRNESALPDRVRCR